jgi:hypothetical protein
MLLHWYGIQGLGGIDWHWVLACELLFFSISGWMDGSMA